MKKIILSMLILVLTMSLFLGVATVYAETYEKDELFQISDGVTFGDPNKPATSGLTLPSGYWVKYVKADGAGHIVEYNGVNLFVTNDNLSMMVPFNAEKYEPVTTPSYKLGAPIHMSSEQDGLMVFPTADCVKGSKIALIENTATALTFLNKVVNSTGTIVYLVATPDNVLGYVKAQFTDVPNLENIPDAPALVEKPLPEPEPDPDSPSTDDQVVPDTGDVILPEDGVIPETDDSIVPTKGNIVKVVLIVAICILAAVLVFLIFKPTRTNKGKYRVDDYDDYERDEEYNDRY